MIFYSPIARLRDTSDARARFRARPSYTIARCDESVLEVAAVASVSASALEPVARTVRGVSPRCGGPGLVPPIPTARSPPHPTLENNMASGALRGRSRGEGGIEAVQ